MTSHCKSNFCVRHKKALVFPIALSLWGCIISTGFGVEKQAAKDSAAPKMEEAAAPLPEYVDNSKLPCFPPVASQGGTGACSVFAACYYQMTHMAGLANGYNNKTSKSNVFAPNWTMNFGVGGPGCYDLAKKNGCASWEDIPFTSDPKVWNTDPAVWARALKHRVDQKGSIGNVDTPQGFYKMKELLSKGYILYFDSWIGSFQFMHSSDDPSTPKDDPYVGKNVVYGVDNYVAGHAFTIVGYNDHMWVDINGNKKVDKGEKGVIKIVNSWSAAYEDLGFTYVAYDGLRENSIVEGVPSKRRKGSVFNYNAAYWVTFKTDYYPRLLAKVTVNTKKRNQLKLQLGYSPTSEDKPKFTWDSYLLNKQGGGSGFDGTDNATDGTFVIDYTDLIAEKKLENTGNGRWYVSITDTEADGNPVVFKDFTLIDNITKKSVKSSSGFPLSTDGSTAHAWVEYSLTLPEDKKKPTAPKNLVVKKFFANTATLEWAESKDNVAIKHYKVFLDGKPYLSTEKNSVTETNLPLGKSYVYTVAAIDTSNNISEISNAVTVRVAETTKFNTSVAYKLLNKKSGKALSVSQGTFCKGVPFLQYNYSNQGMQHYTFADAGDGSYRIKTKPGVMLLQVDCEAMDNGARVIQWTDNGSDSCKWIITPSGTDTYMLINKNNGKVLSVVDASVDEGKPLEQTTFTNDDSQLWHIKDIAK